MLNPKYKLNPKIFDTDVEINPTRAGFGEGLLELGDKNPNIVGLTADLSESTKADKFEKKYPDRFFDVGVAEQDMAAVAAGLAVSGKIPFISSYATFSPGKNWETIRTTIIYNKANVKIAGHHSGVMTGPDGCTHQATEDIASVRSWPGLNIIVPCDSIEAKKATIIAGDTEGPFYLRFSRDKSAVMTTDETPFEFGKMANFWIPDSPAGEPQVTIFAMGYMLYYALLAAKELETEGIQTLVVNAPTIKPFDTEGLLEFTKISRAVVTVEDHQVMGGLGGVIAEYLSKSTPLPMEMVALQDTFAESGKPKELLAKYHMDVPDIKEAVKKIIGRK